MRNISETSIWEPWGESRRVALWHCQARGPLRAGTLPGCLLVPELSSVVSRASSQRPGRADLRFRPEVGFDGRAAAMEVGKWHKSRLLPQRARWATPARTPLPLTQKEMQVLLKWGSMGCEHGHCALELMRFILGHRDHCNCPEGPSSYKSGVGVDWERGSADVP